MSEFIEEPDTIRNELMDNGALIGEQMTTNGEWLDYLANNAPDELSAWFDAERITNQAEMLHMPESHESANPDCSAMLYKTFTGNMCSHYEPKDGVVAILREAARNLSDYHDAGEALRRLTDTLNVYHALETLADMIERDYVRRESIEEVMDNDRALVDENSMLARELLKLRAELEKATNNLNSANEDFENARAELTAERDKLKELNEYHALQYELASEDADRLQAKVDELKAELTHFERFKNKVIPDLRAERDQWRDAAGTVHDMWEQVVTERNNWKANCEDWKKDCERYRSKFGKCIDYADAIHALMDDEGMA